MLSGDRRTHVVLAVSGALAAGLLVASVGLADGTTTPAASEGATERRSDPATRSPDRFDAGPATTTSTSTTTTMPPRAEPALLAPSGSGPLQGRLIVVDPGHNGANFAFGDVRRPLGPDADPATEGPLCNSTGTGAANGLREVDVNWAIGTRLATLLRSLGAAVLLTHADNEGFGPCADERGKLAATANAALLVSIHADGSVRGSGFHVIHPSAAPETGPGLPVDSVERSAALARQLRDQLLVVGGRPANYVGTNGTQQRADLANLNHAVVPAILAELGNLRNPLDATMLGDGRSREVLARALARAVLATLGLPADPRVGPDLDGDGAIDLLVGAPEWLLPTTTTTTTTLPVTPEASAPVDPATTVPPTTAPTTTSTTVATTAAGVPPGP